MWIDPDNPIKIARMQFDLLTPGLNLAPLRSAIGMME
jgi:hypothetical protein